MKQFQINHAENILVVHQSSLDRAEINFYCVKCMEAHRLMTYIVKSSLNGSLQFSFFPDYFTDTRHPSPVSAESSYSYDRTPILWFMTLPFSHFSYAFFVSTCLKRRPTTLGSHWSLEVPRNNLRPLHYLILNLWTL